MPIKAIGIVKRNRNDGKSRELDRNKRFDLPRRWYFYTSPNPVWKVSGSRQDARELLKIAFEEEQDIIVLGPVLTGLRSWAR